jgi:hypothetical protein
VQIQQVQVSDALTTTVTFGGLSSVSPVRFLSEKISIVIHRNIRFVLPLMVKVEMPVSYQVLFYVRQRTRHQKHYDE